jgi:hypothetical protein
MRRKHPLASGRLTMERYCNARHLLVSFSGRPWGFIDEALASLDRQRRVVLTVNQFFTAGRVVAHSNLAQRHAAAFRARDRHGAGPGAAQAAV